MEEPSTPAESPPPGDLPGIWRERAEFLQEYGHRKSARLWERAATELDKALRVLSEDSLTLVETAALCGYSADHLGSLVRRGKIPNAGRKHAPRIRRVEPRHADRESAWRCSDRSDARGTQRHDQRLCPKPGLQVRVLPGL